MSKIANPLTPNPQTRNPEIYTRLEVLWGGLGDLVHETAGGCYDGVLDYFKLSSTASSSTRIVEGESLVFNRTNLLACWSTPEKSNDITVGHNRNYALRVDDTYSFRRVILGDMVSMTKVTTEFMIGRWATACAQKINDEVIIKQTDEPSVMDMVQTLDLTKVLEQNKERFAKKKRDYQDFRDKARGLQQIDVEAILQEGDSSIGGDIIMNGTRVSSIVDDIRRSANAANNTRLTIVSSNTLWRRGAQLADEDIDKA